MNNQCPAVKQDQFAVLEERVAAISDQTERILDKLKGFRDRIQAPDRSMPQIEKCENKTPRAPNGFLQVIRQRMDAASSCLDEIEKELEELRS